MIFELGRSEILSALASWLAYLSNKILLLRQSPIFNRFKPNLTVK